MTLDAFPEEPALPQLKIASDPELMREMFRGHLSPLPGSVYHIQDCLLSWVRYLRDVRCTLQYTLRLLEPGTGRERNQWVSGVIYAEDRAGRMWRKLRAAHPGQEVPQAFLTFEPVSFIPDLNMLVQVFPYDRRLPALPLLMTRPSPDLEHQLLDWFGPGNWHADVWNIEPIRYRAGARAVLRYDAEMRDAATGGREKRRFYVKVYRGEAGERTSQVLQALWKRAEAGGAGFTVGKPTASPSWFSPSSPSPVRSWIPPPSWLIFAACRCVSHYPTTGHEWPRGPLPRNTSPMSQRLGAAGSRCTTPVPL